MDRRDYFTSTNVESATLPQQNSDVGLSQGAPANAQDAKSSEVTQRFLLRDTIEVPVSWNPKQTMFVFEKR